MFNTINVPTLIKGINDQQVGDIIRFAVDNIDIVRGVNFQPVLFAGRTPADEVEEQRVTVPDFERVVEEQTESKIKIEDFYTNNIFIIGLFGIPVITVYLALSKRELVRIQTI